MDDKNLNKRFKEQNEILEKILEQSEKTKKYLLWLKILSIIKIAIIVIPIILGIIYLPPFMKKMIEKYQDVVPGLEKIQKMIETQR